ncbi:metalloregulator ArsR/SmtB family transcription factor [Gloeobacter kilaueensis]|uniref:ArsR family transcriptional regulator n=1 Tax=Gloeobacter kilaueensis (strain ATCC BAA-2537 / CCAP 1431/1 / ULC 316 / JS1) TaxID=1183438 RepID=U5QBQ5_GLOK1|nr:metalloregulator ArsR/SmtB family transcription factor [Gloeobacter kilaueensis]AGY56302.1 ArsR family transcriptional regulator [Gloeobacter kilaueensis JS1]
MERTEFQVLLDFFKALANESRLKMAGLLSTREHSVEELAVLLRLKEPTVSHHLAVLKGARLVQMRAEGNTHWYRLDPEVLQTMSQVYLSPTRVSELAPQVMEDAWECKILTNFFDGQRLKEIPASRKKRWVILKWLAQRFEPDVAYAEAQVNETLKRHHPDCATLRRELIGYRMMEREQGIYRLLPEEQWQPA